MWSPTSKLVADATVIWRTPASCGTESVVDVVTERPLGIVSTYPPAAASLLNVNCAWSDLYIAIFPPN